ncbi:RecQ family ATP-dependent DNA helicase [Robiginitalea sediminis]|uniref:RecQ family ATP-dependent DNA helicase n=1 Tax=Robiginitalea sediminis TaxID=1982593 RepID=UPI000B4B20E3|nr:RecQ family ATP-dependent DNA helicase [Robiginitalea sediminis]
MADPVLDILKQYWGYPNFRGRQQDVVETLVSGRDAVVLFPTGGGKSLCYQVPGMALEGICLVVSPLVALMEDQLEDLKSRGIRAVGLYGRLPEPELVRRLDQAAFGSCKFLYLSPERLRQDLVFRRLQQLPLSLIAIDEAHCISQWGYDFRPAYLECARLREPFPHVPMAALTATAPAEVLKDIRTVLQLEDAPVFRDSARRENLTFRVLETEDKYHRLREALTRETGSAIVYVQTRKASIQIAAWLERQGIAAGHYHGGMPEAGKRDALGRWQKGKLRVMVATNAFGMGIDKADVRLVVHYQLPETLEHYYQEAGRAGRDGKPAMALLLSGPSDPDRSREFFLESLPTVADLILVYRKLCNYFQVSYGEMPEEEYSFGLEAFCAQYKLPPNKTFQALEVLDRQGVISLRPLVRTEARLQVVAPKAAIWDFLGRQPAWQDLVQTLLRTYGGLFDYPTEIQLPLLQKKLGWPEARILEGLRQMEQASLTEVDLRQGDLQLAFTMPREDDRSIHAFSGAYRTRQKVKVRKVNQMIAYAANSDICRRVQLLDYFGEKDSQACGRCDVCQPEPVGIPETETLRREISEALREGPRTSREILEKARLPETALLRELRHMLEEGLLTLGPASTYILKTS